MRGRRNNNILHKRSKANMKKKLTAIFLCVALVAIAIVGASLAYFTDTDKGMGRLFGPVTSMTIISFFPFFNQQPGI